MHVKQRCQEAMATVYREHQHKTDNPCVQLMFSNKDDPPSVKEARAIEKAYIRQWIQEAREKKKSASSLRTAVGSASILTI